MTEHDGVIDEWRKSSESGSSDCVEVRVTTKHIHVRDTKDPDGPVLSFTYREWQAFLSGVRLGEFDVPGVESA